MEGTDRSRDVNQNRDVLERIVALLFALARLADLAAGLPALRRRQVLGILIRGEAEARAFVIGTAPGAPAPADVPEPAGDAKRLAASFRALALVLCAMLAQARRFERAGAAGPRAARRKPGGWAGLSGRAALPAPDTS